MYKFAYVHDSNYFLSKYFIYRNISGLGKLRTNVTLPTLGCICSVQDICNFSKIINLLTKVRKTTKSYTLNNKVRGEIT